MKIINILFIATSHDRLGDTGRRTGIWLEELAAPYYVFREAGAAVKLASPKGGRIPVDPKSQSIIVATRSVKRFLKDSEAMDFLSHSILPQDVKADDFDAVFIPGGHGAMWDLTGNGMVKQLVEDFNSAGKPIGAICHGVAALLSLQNNKAEVLIRGRQITGFSNSEEEATGLAMVLPFLLETKLRSLGALYARGIDYTGYIVVDDNIITGQNPASSEEAAKRLLILLESNKQEPVLPQTILN